MIKMRSGRGVGWLVVALLFLIQGDFSLCTDMPLELDENLMKGFEENFMSHISPELKEKLKNRASKGENLDLDDLDAADLSEDEKKQLETALKDALTPLFGVFVQMIVKSGIPGKINKNIDAENVDTGKKEDGRELDAEKSSSNDSDTDDKLSTNENDGNSSNKANTEKEEL